MSPAPRRASDAAQATVELAVVLPVVVLLMLLVVQVGQVVYHRVLVVHVAREVVRAASVSPLAPTATDVARRHGLDAGRITVEVGVPDGSGFVRAAVAYDVSTEVAVVGALLPDVTVGAEATMSVEWTRRNTSLKPRRRRWSEAVGGHRPCRGVRCRCRTWATARTTGSRECTSRRRSTRSWP